MTHDITDDGFHEIHLSGKQLVFLFMATTVVSVVIFLCGVLVGRGVQAQQPFDQLSDPLATSQTPSAPLSDTGPLSDEPPAPPAETDELTYKRRLEAGAGREALAPAPKPRAEPPAATPQPAARTAARTATQERVQPPPPAVTASRTASPPPSDPAPAAPAAQPGTFVVQVHALRDRSAASGIVKRLVGKGYSAFLVSSGPPTGMYKVQIGRFKDRSEAERTLNRLKKEEQFEPWITR